MNSIGDLVMYNGTKATIKGFKYTKGEPLAIIEIYNKSNPFMDMMEGTQPKKKDIRTVDTKELKVIQSIWDHFFILKIGDEKIPFNNMISLSKAITPKNFNRAEVFEIKKLGKPEIRVPANSGSTLTPDNSVFPNSDGGWSKW